MAIEIPTTQTIIDENLARIESNLNQNTPENDKAFNAVIAVTEGMQDAQLYRFAVDRAKQCLAITAGEDGLTILGQEYNVPRKAAVKAILTIEITGTNGTIIPAGRDFIGDSNGLLYFSESSVTIAAGIASVNITADIAGSDYNLSVSDTLQFVTQLPGANTQVTVTAIDTLGVDQEALSAWRIRILDEERSQGGGGNGYDYRKWGQEVAGVQRIFPYSGKPYGSPLVDAPPDRTLYVQATTDIDPDGIAPAILLDAVEESVTYDPITGRTRQPLGLTNDTLYIESIDRLQIYIEIRNLDVDAALVTQVQNAIATAMEQFLTAIAPYVPGLDAETERRDTITTAVVDKVVQDVVGGYGGTVEAVGFGLAPGSTIPTYTLNPGELTKTGAITYVYT